MDITGARRARCAFTLFELLIAVVLIEFGLLALVGTTAVALRESADAHARAIATDAASSRLELLRLAGCAPQSGAATTRGGAEHWTVAGARPVVVVRDSVVYHASAGERSVVLQTNVPC